MVAPRLPTAGLRPIGAILPGLLHGIAARCLDYQSARAADSSLSEDERDRARLDAEAFRRRLAANP